MWHVFGLIAAVNLVFYAIASQAVGETAKGQSALIIAYLSIFICRALHKHEPNQGENKNKIANISIILSFFYPISLHAIVVVSALSGTDDLSSDSGGFGQFILILIILIAGLILANSFLMINIGFLLNTFSTAPVILVIFILLGNALVIATPFFIAANPSVVT